ncbi:MAG: glutamate racemase [Fusobacteria bacterium]|nr:glutamate racemase [Fusobacteriota bacterium]
MKNKSIGVFDSGLGGLTVTKEIINLLPNENIIYFGDTARVPYGTKSKNAVVKYAKEIVRFLMTKDVKMIVIACNTASALALEEIKSMINIPVIGVIKAGSKRAIATTVNGKIGVIATNATIDSNAYKLAIENLNKNVEIYQKACPLFVPLIEEGMIEDEITDLIAKRYLSTLNNDIDTLVLGCTHYPLIKETLSKIIGDNVTLIDSAEETAILVKNILLKLDIFKEQSTNNHQFYVSDAPEKFQKIGKLFLKSELNNVEKIDIEQY